MNDLEKMSLALVVLAVVGCTTHDQMTFTSNPEGIGVYGPTPNGYRDFGKTPVTIPIDLPWVNSGFAHPSQSLRFALYEDERIHWISLDYTYNPWSYTWNRTAPSPDVNAVHVDFEKQAKSATDGELRTIGKDSEVSEKRLKKLQKEVAELQAKTDAKLKAQNEADTRKSLEEFHAALAGSPEPKLAMRVITLFMESSVAQCSGVLDEYSSTWSSAIDSRANFSLALHEKAGRLTAQGVFRSMEQKEAAIKTALGKVHDIPETLIPVHAVLVDYYSVYAECFTLAKSPTGSLLSFNQRRERLESDARRASAKLDLLTR